MFFEQNNNEWLKYTDDKLWISINYPKFNYVDWIPYFVKVQSDFKTDKISVFTKGDLPIKDYFKISFYIYDINNDLDIEKIIKKYYWKWCVFDWLKYNNNYWYYDIEIWDDPILRKKYVDWPICMKNFVSKIFYNKEISKLVYWEVWQEPQFNFKKEYDSSFKSDNFILNSFKFIGKLIINKFKIKSKKIIFKDLILSKKALEKSSKWKIYKLLVDKKVDSLNNKKLIIFNNLLWKLNLDSSKYKKYKLVLEYMKAKTGIEIWNRDSIDKEEI